MHTRRDYWKRLSTLGKKSPRRQESAKKPWKRHSPVRRCLLSRHSEQLSLSIGEIAFRGMWVTIGAIPRDASVVTHSLTIGEKCFLRSHTVIYAGSVIGNLFETGHGAIVRERVASGNRVLLGSHSEIEPDTIIGDDVRIHSSCFVAEGSVLERGVRLYPGARLASDKHPWMENRLKKRKGPTLREG